MKPTPTTHLRLKARYLPPLLGLLLLLQLFFPHKSWTILLVVLGGAWLVGYRWARSLADGLELTRERRFGWAQVGDHLQERFTLVNNGWAPAQWVAVLDHSTLPGYSVSTVKPVGERALIHWFTRGVCHRRGLYRLGPTSLETADPFGFYTVKLTYPATVTMMVMPPILHLPTIEVAPGGRAGEGHLLARAALDRAVNAAGVREYAQGDSLRWIHWPTSARRDDFFVRTFDPTPSSDWWIFLDMDRRVQAGMGQTATEEHGVILAASLASRGLQSGVAVGLVAHGRSLTWLPPRLGDDQRWRILRALALVELGQRPLAQLLARTRTALRGRSSAVIITADVEGKWLDTMVLLLRRGIVPTVLLLDRPAFGGQGDAGQTLATLEALGVAHRLITPDLLDRPEARPGQVGQWRQTAPGRWEPKFDPKKLDWKTLA